MNLQVQLQSLVEPAIRAVAPEVNATAFAAQLKVASKPEFGDYQLSCAMALASQLKQKPQAVAQALVEKIPVNDWIESAQVAGPGHINITLKRATLEAQLRQVIATERLGVGAPERVRTWIVDYSGPNVAKPLHVGHLRSTIIGDALVRILRFAGHQVIGDNHLGDWGTQFGILIYGYKHFRDDAAFAADPVRELARLYVEVRKHFVKAQEEDDDEAPVADPIKEACRQETAKLHAGDPANLALWRQFMPACLAMLQPIYDRLQVQIDQQLGESFYHDRLPGVVADLLARGIARESQGAVIVPNAAGQYPTTQEALKTEEPPALIRKRDGAFTYTTTDLATIQYRAEQWQPDGMLYVVDARQALHFKTLFANARRWGYDQIEFQHIQFGSILGANGKPFQTREGGTVELAELMEEAVRRAGEKYEQSLQERIQQGYEVPELTELQRREVAEVVGLGALKYADLSSNRVNNYVFSYEKMLATVGNTATYMQYAYARCKNILRKQGLEGPPAPLAAAEVLLEAPEERALGLLLLRFPESLAEAVHKYEPHHLANYLWDLSRAANKFYDSCPVLTAETPALKTSRLWLVWQTGRTIQQTLALLGIQTVERM